MCVILQSLHIAWINHNILHGTLMLHSIICHEQLIYKTLTYVWFMGVGGGTKNGHH